MAEILTSLGAPIVSVMDLLQVLVGGVFGLYVIIFLWRIYDSRMTRKMLKDMQKQISSLRQAVKRLENYERKEFKDKINELIHKVDNNEEMNNDSKKKSSKK